MPTPSNFQLNTKKVFLTYPRCDINKEILRDHLASLGTIVEYKIARELHEDGFPHLHAFVSYKQSIRTTNNAFFDFQTSLQTYHPNVQGVRNRRQVLDYLSKGGDFIEQLLQDGSTGPADDKWSRIISESRDYDDFIRLAKDTCPREFILFLRSIQYSARFLYPIEQTTVPRQYDNFSITRKMQEWVDTMLDGIHDRPKCLYLSGPSRTGKTEWARSLGQHIYFNTIFNLDDWDDSAKYAVFDDFEFQYIPNKKFFLGSQKQGCLTDKYRHKKTVTWGKPSIFLVNEDQDIIKLNSEPIAFIEWFNKNVVYIEITNKLY